MTDATPEQIVAFLTGANMTPTAWYQSMRDELLAEIRRLEAEIERLRDENEKLLEENTWFRSLLADILRDPDKIDRLHKALHEFAEYLAQYDRP